MKDSLLKAFIKFLIFKLWWLFFLALYAVLTVTTIIIQGKISINFSAILNSPPLVRIWLFTSGLFFAIAVIGTPIVAISALYKNFKKYIYGKTTIPEKIEEINLSGISSDIVGIVKDIVTILKRHDERIANIEKNLSATRLTLIGIYVGVGVGVAMLTITLISIPLFQKLLFSK